MDMASLPKAAALASAGARNPRWHAGAAPALHNEIFALAEEGAGAGAALAFARAALRGAGDDGARERAVLWVQDEQAIARGGRPYRAGLPEDLRHRLIHVAARRPEDALFALEEGLRCRDLAAVIGEVTGNPRALDFTASRRLTLATERHGVPLFLVRLDARADLSSARMRWRVRPAASAPPLWDRGAPGCPAWHAELFRSRSHAPGEWILRDDRHALFAEPATFDHAPPAAAPDPGDLVHAAGA